MSMNFSLVKVARMNEGHVFLEDLAIYLLSSLTKKSSHSWKIKRFLQFNLMIGNTWNVYFYFKVHLIGPGWIVADKCCCMLLPSNDSVFVGKLRNNWSKIHFLHVALLLYLHHYQCLLMYHCSHPLFGRLFIW